MTGEFTVDLDHDTGQLTMTGPPTGPAGGAILAPVPGLDLLFDRRTGQLGRLTIDLPEPGRARNDHGPSLQRTLPRLFGAASARAIQRALRTAPKVMPEPAVTPALSRLALFDAARATSPVPAMSPLWPAEAALLAERAGLPARARVEAIKAAADLADLAARMPLPDALAPAVAGVSRLASADQPEVTRALREGVKWFDGSLTAWLAESGPTTTDPLETRPPAVPHQALDLASLPASLLIPGLTPDTDLVSYLDDAGVLVVEGCLVPGADPQALARCRARLVDPQQRLIIAQAPLTRDGVKVRARLPLPAHPAHPADPGDLSRTRLEVVADDAPVRGTTLRAIRQALRWADAALRAERRPHGLAPGWTDDRWARLARESWEKARDGWTSAGDHDRADQAIQPPQPPRLPQPGYLAETIGPLL